MRRRVALFGTVGVLATAFGLGLLVVPSLFRGIGPFDQFIASVGAVDPRSIMLVAGLVAGLYVIVTARSQPESPSQPSDADQQFEAAISDPPESVTADRSRIAATEIDDEISVAVTVGGTPLQEVRSFLRTTAARTYADVADISQTVALQRIERGEWTDDATATTFLAGPAGPKPTVLARLRLWVMPERERRRRIERSIGAIEQLEAGEP